jgi:hypothetical protein
MSVENNQWLISLIKYHVPRFTDHPPCLSSRIAKLSPSQMRTSPCGSACSITRAMARSQAVRGGHVHASSPTQTLLRVLATGKSALRVSAPGRQVSAHGGPRSLGVPRDEYGPQSVQGTRSQHGALPPRTTLPVPCECRRRLQQYFCLSQIHASRDYVFIL